VSVTGGEERDWREHLAALQRFGGQMPLSPFYIPRRCTHHKERNNADGNLLAESKKWKSILDAMGDEEAEKKRESSHERNEPDSKS
jgi:hypothetical protein